MGLKPQAESLSPFGTGSFETEGNKLLAGAVFALPGPRPQKPHEATGQKDDGRHGLDCQNPETLLTG